MFNFDDMEEDLQSQEAEENSSAADEILESLDQDQESDEEDIDATMSLAVKRIEEANLFKLLIKQPVFAEGSASTDILQSVNKKVREFAKKELEILLGLRPAKEEVKIVQQKVELPFSEQEVAALKIIASKITKREPSVQTTEEKIPTMNAIQVQDAQPKIQPAKPALAQHVTKSAVNQPQQKQKPQAAQTQKKSTTPKVSAKNRPKPKAMPNAAQLGAMYQMNQSGVVMSTEGVNQNAVKTSNQLLGNIINQMAGIHTDNSSPAESVDAGDVNDRF